MVISWKAYVIKMVVLTNFICSVITVQADYFVVTGMVVLKLRKSKGLRLGKNQSIEEE